MKIGIGCLLVVVGIVVGLYVGVYLMLIGGIIQIIDSIKHDFNAVGIAIGIVRIWFASVMGWLFAIAFFIPGKRLMRNAKIKRT